jgi:hypothetical protein
VQKHCARHANQQCTSASSTFGVGGGRPPQADPSVSLSLPRGQLEGDQLCKRRVLEEWTGWNVRVPGKSGLAFGRISRIGRRASCRRVVRRGWNFITYRPDGSYLQHPLRVIGESSLSLFYILSKQLTQPTNSPPYSSSLLLVQLPTTQDPQTSAQ